MQGYRGDRGGDRGSYRGGSGREEYGYRRSPYRGGRDYSPPPRRSPYRGGRDYSPKRSPHGGKSRRDQTRSPPYSPYHSPDRNYGHRSR